MVNYKKFSVFLFFWCISHLLALECFLSCGDFDNCDNTKCEDQCGPSNQFSSIAFTVETCTSTDDFCIYREFLLADKNGNPDIESVHIPGGCLLSYQRSPSTLEKFNFGDGVKLFGCDTDFCNPPLLDDCGETEAVARKNGESAGDSCEVDNGENLATEFLFGSTELKGGDAADRREFCLNAENFVEFNEEEACFGLTGAQGEAASTCSSLDEIEELPVTTCAECLEDSSCDVNAATPEPTVAETDSPTSKPTAQPSANPSKAPSEAPTAQPSANPSVNPTSRPTVEPTDVGETERPSVSPTTKAPTSTPTPEEEVTNDPTAEPTNAPVSEPEEEEVEVGFFGLDEFLFITLLGVLVFSLCCFTALCFFFCLRREPTRVIKQKEYVVPQEDITIVNQMQMPGVYLASPMLQQDLDAVVVEKQDDGSSDGGSSVDVAQFIEANDL